MQTVRGRKRKKADKMDDMDSPYDRGATSEEKPMRPDQAKPVADRIRALVVITDAGCWEWQGGFRAGTGYGRISVGSRADGTRRDLSAHVAAYLEFKGEIPEGMEIDHLCRNRACCNPDHLEAVPHKVNLRRAPTQPSTANATKTHCKRGHEYNEQNTWHDRRGKRQCRACRRKFASTGTLTRPATECRCAFGWQPDCPQHGTAKKMENA
jgi:hypothetical protein